MLPETLLTYSTIYEINTQINFLTD